LRLAVSLDEYEKALKSLEDALGFFDITKDISIQKIARDACIQRFEFCIELAWKSAGKKMGSASMAANTIVREMAREGLIDSPELWLEYIAARNETSHTYDENTATRVFQTIRGFLPPKTGKSSST
jgi:nucleotidyltransferase substrate binding protein (TIGR01987 family)